MSYSIVKKTGGPAAASDDEWDGTQSMNVLSYGPLAKEIREFVARSISILGYYPKMESAKLDDSFAYIEQMRAAEATKPLELIDPNDVVSFNFTSTFSRPANHLLLFVLYDQNDEFVWIGRMEADLRYHQRNQVLGSFMAIPGEPVELTLAYNGWDAAEISVPYPKAVSRARRGAKSRIILFIQPEEGSFYYSS